MDDVIELRGDEDRRRDEEEEVAVDRTDERDENGENDMDASLVFVLSLLPMFLVLSRLMPY